MRKLVQLLLCIAVVAMAAVVVGESVATTQRHSAHLTVAPISHRPANDPRVARVRTDVTIMVDGDQRVARVEIEDQFRNNGGGFLEGDYLYPIPPGAVFTDLSLFMGEQELKGEMLPAGTARGIYEEIVRRKKDPALIELVDHGLLRARVFPIAAGETRRIILRYTQVLGRDGHLIRLRHPRVVGMFETDEGPMPVGRPEPRFEAVIRPGATSPFHMQINVTDAELFAAPYSPTHRIEVLERDSEVEVTYDDSGEARRDFELFLPLREDSVGASVVTHAFAGEPGFYMMLLSPPVASEESTMPRDLTMVLDVSGSMSGDKIVQARAAMDQMLAGLADDDRFRVITFSSVVRQFRSGWSIADREAVSAARDWLASVDADGSTNIQAALQEALRPATNNARMAQIVFLTDGKPTVGETAVERIVDLTTTMIDDERLFAFGVGHDVNTFLLDSLVEGGRGTVSYVGPAEDVEQAVSSLTRKIRHPALADLRIVEAPVMLEDGYPQELPDLFHGEDLVLLGRYRDNGSGPLIIEGTRGGRVERFEFNVDFRDERGNGFIPKLWAARKAGALTTQVRLHGANPELVEEIRQLGLRYGVLTEYTSYLVEEPGMSLDDATLQQVMQRVGELEVGADRQAGAVAFNRARASSEARRVNNVEAAQEAIVAAAPPPGRTPRVVGAGDLAAAPGRRDADEVDGPEAFREGATQHVVDRMFVVRAGVWTDLRFSDERVVRVAPFSAAYFELVQRLPELRPFFAVGQRVIIAADGLAIEIADAGATEWAGGELEAVLRAFGS